MAGKIQGTVVSISESGDALTDIANERLDETPMDDRVSIHCEGHVTSRIFAAAHEEPPMTFLAKCGESGFLELSLVGDNLHAFLGIAPGNSVVVKW